MGVDLDAKLFWGLAFDSPTPPWSTAHDYDPAEEWQDRFARRIPSGQPDGLDVTRFVVEPYGVADSPGTLIALAESMVRAEWTAPTRFEGFIVGADWEACLRSFCDVLAIPWRAPGWVVVPYLY